MENENRPFDFDYVICVTKHEILKCIDRSINKTFERTKEFQKDTSKTTEAFSTLSYLHQLRVQIDESIKYKPKGGKNVRSKRN
jgi:hypothetical protein